MLNVIPIGEEFPEMLRRELGTFPGRAPCDGALAATGKAGRGGATDVKTDETMPITAAILAQYLTE